MAGTSSYKFLTGGSAAGTFPTTSVKWKGGKIALGAVAATWGTGSVQFTMSLGGKMVSIGTAITADAAPQVVDIPPCELQAVVTGATFTGLNIVGVEVPTNTRH